MITAEQKLCLKPVEVILDGYLSVAPLAHALHRTAEAYHLSRIHLERPILELGCGAGDFAKLAVNRQIEAGVDLSAKQLRWAEITGCYRRLYHADAHELPFSDRCFYTVLAVSVLEHVTEVGAVLEEVFRVLQPGGRLVATVVLRDLHRHLFYPHLFRSLGLPLLGRLYMRWQDHLFKHHTLLEQADWEHLLDQAGFQLVVSQKIVSPALTAWWDFLLVFAWPSLLGSRRDRAVVLHPAWLCRLVKKHFYRLLSCEEEGSNLLLVAQKPSNP
jgi:ubiquinone/menaquinone biosynthesis C-methylase UbiE